MSKRARHSDRKVATVADRLHSVAIHLLRDLRRVDDATGLSAPRLSALSVLVFGGPCTIGRLAVLEQVRAPSMTRLVQALEHEGLVRRRAGAEDRRKPIIQATAKGRRILLRARGRRVAMLAARLRGLSKAEQAAIAGAIGVLERVARGVE